MGEPESAAGVPISERMQTLLARAAEDQLTEQRQLGDALVDLRAQMTQITSDLAGLRADVGESRGDGGVGAVSAEVRDAVRLIGERLDGLARMVHQRGLDIAELRGSFGELKTSVMAHSDVLSGLTGGMESIPSYGERVAALQQTVAALSDRLSGLDDVRSAVGDVDTRVGSTADALVDLRSTLHELRARVDSINAAGDLEATGQRVTVLSERIDGLSTATAPLAAGMSSLQEALRQETERNAALTAQLDDLRTQLGSVATSANDMRSENENLARQLDGMQEDITVIGGNVAGLVESGIDPADLASALEAARTAAEQAGRMSEIAVQVADVRAALVGAEGLEHQVAALAERLDQHDEAAAAADLDGRIQAAVAGSVAASERRLSEHLDEAVLALAEILLRRRPGRVSSAVGRSPAAAAVEDALAAEPLPDELLPDETFAESVPALDVELPTPADMSGTARDDNQSEAWDDESVPPDAPVGDADAPVGDADAPLGGADALVDDDAGEQRLDSEELAADDLEDDDLEVDDELVDDDLEAGELEEFDDDAESDDYDDEYDDDYDDDELDDELDGDVDEDAGALAVDPGYADLNPAAATPDTSGLPTFPEPASVPAMADAAPNQDWTATVTSEVTVEQPKRRRRPWWRPGD